MPMSEVYAVYSRWAQQNGEWAMKRLALKKKLIRKGYLIPAITARQPSSG